MFLYRGKKAVKRTQHNFIILKKMSQQHTIIKCELNSFIIINLNCEFIKHFFVFCFLFIINLTRNVCSFVQFQEK